MDGAKPGDALALFMKNGWTCFRLRIWVDPRNGVNGLEYTTQLAKRIKDAGGTFMLDFHYSDWWADPQKQNKPAAWAKLDFDALVKQVETYTASVIKTLKDAGATPDFVQIGNEITGGTLWPDAQVKVPLSTVKVFSGDVVVITPPEPYDDAKQWDHLIRVLKAADAGVRSVTTPADHVRIIVHIDCGGDWPVTKWYFDHLTSAGVDFDIIGQSFLSELAWDDGKSPRQSSRDDQLLSQGRNGRRNRLSFPRRPSVSGGREEHDLADDARGPKAVSRRSHQDGQGSAGRPRHRRQLLAP